jgi:small neutral amino acid transporter SnatA (MarC family)
LDGGRAFFGTNLYAAQLCLQATFASVPHDVTKSTSLPDIEIAGGIFVFYVAWGLLTAQPKVSSAEAREAANASDIAFFPLTMPITAGAGSLAVTISLSSRVSHSGTSALVGYGGVIIGIALVFVSVALCYRFADAIFRRIGEAGTTVVTRLTAFILLAIGVEMIWGGLKPLILSCSVRRRALRLLRGASNRCALEPPRITPPSMRAILVQAASSERSGMRQAFVAFIIKSNGGASRRPSAAVDERTVPQEDRG